VNRTDGGTVSSSAFAILRLMAITYPLMASAIWAGYPEYLHKWLMAPRGSSRRHCFHLEDGQAVRTLR
jgi:hypothetical protein